ncbi:hypothetical protein LZV00_11635 [Pseudomonas kielensis]|uniref:Rid family hydrolase n=1 Tax=Pseudomonas kielensis TaxID=2762577 RepID=UPI00223F16B7|nr:Rid family hydrolase [Pseudomonas kielensis]UZM16308.1 hypothetical protein LZV00_11635 [Pseudomonas kielensis]
MEFCEFTWSPSGISRYFYMLTLRKILLGLSTIFVLAGAQAAEGDIVRYSAANSSVPVAAAVEVPASASLVYLSGKLPPLQDATQPHDSPLAYGGDTKGQTIAVLKAIEKSLADLGLTLGNVVKIQVFLIGNPAQGNKMDASGFMVG